MIPRTINNLGAFEVLSALQKHIRRNEEREAMLCACELGHTSKGFFTMLCNRLEVIAHEDIGLANPEAVIFTALAVECARRTYDPNKPGKWRMILGNVIRMLCRSEKSREGDHFQAAIGLGAMLEGKKPEIPDYAHDQHTMLGRQKGRGLKFFREVSTKLVPTPKHDSYEDEAYRLWEVKQSQAAKGNDGTDQAEMF